jgi:hypothetical protein
VVDVGGARRNPEFPDQLMADVLLIKRFEPLGRQTQVFDCAGFRRADPPAADATGGWTLDWVDVGADDPLLRAACGT